MKILFVSHSSNLYGAERVLLDLVIGLRGKKIESMVILPSFGPLCEKLKKEQIKYKIIPFKGWASGSSSFFKRILRIIFNIFAVPRFYLLIRKEKPDLIVTSSAVTPPIGAIVAYIFHIPHFWYIHELVEKKQGLSYNLGINFSTKLINKFSKLVIVNSIAVKNKYKNYIPEGKLKLIYCGIELKEKERGEIGNIILNHYEDYFQLCTVAYISSGKGQMDAVRTINLLVKEGYKVVLFIVGGGDSDYIAEIKQFINIHHLENNIFLSGFLENPKKIYEISDVSLMCSRMEAFGRVTVEAMLHKKPIIGARSGGTLELIKEGFNGFFYEPGNFTELAEKIKYLINNKTERLKMGENAYWWAKEKFSLQKFIEEFYKICQKFL